MSRLTLTRIVRSTDVSGLGDLPIDVRFDNQVVWGPYPLGPGADFNLTSPPAGVPASNIVGPYNADGQLQLFAQVVINDATWNFPIPTEGIPTSSVSSLPLGPGERTLVYRIGNISYTVYYVIIGDFGTATIAFLLGTGNAVVTFLTTLATLVINYFSSLLFLIGSGRGNVSNDRINRR